MNTYRRSFAGAGLVLIVLFGGNVLKPQCAAFAQDAVQEGEEVGACCLPDGSCELLDSEACFDAGGYFWGEGTTCDPNPCKFVCCTPEAYYCKEYTKNNCEILGGTWLGVGVFCPDPSDPSLNPCRFGACCLPDAVCLVMNQEDCSHLDGDFQGYWTDCISSPLCGACCIDHHTCANSMTKYRCESEIVRGLWVGPTTTCADVECELLYCPADLDESDQVDVGDLLVVLAQWGPCPPVCLADLTGDGVVDVLDILEVLDGWGPCP